MAFAINAEVRDPWAKVFAFAAQKTRTARPGVIGGTFVSAARHISRARIVKLSRA
jgi:hypothetical protein